MSSSYDEKLMDSVFEAALHGFMMQRCERAYIHELRDGLQGISVSIDALSRLAEGKAPSSVSSERVVSLAKRALQTHDQGIGAVVKQLVLQRDERSAVELNSLLRQIATLLRNDAAAREVSIRVECGTLHALARESRLRLVVLCLAVNAIDALHGGELTVSSIAADSGDSSGVMIRFSLPIEKIAHNDAWIATFDGTTENEPWMLHAIKQIIHADGGVLSAGRESIAGQDCRVVRVRYETGVPANDDAVVG
jgi:signal transduction histidine kinase